jgi:hypothetical protein
MRVLKIELVREYVGKWLVTCGPEWTLYKKNLQALKP